VFADLVSGRTTRAVVDAAVAIDDIHDGITSRRLLMSAAVSAGIFAKAARGTRSLTVPTANRWRTSRQRGARHIA
jgi:hypothetical protein